MAEFLVRFLKKEEKDGEVTFVVLNKRLFDLIMQPMRIVSGTDDNQEVTEIEKDECLCDQCNDVNPEFVMTDGSYLSRTICEKCRQKYFKDIEIREDSEDSDDLCEGCEQPKQKCTCDFGISQGHGD